MTSILIGAIAGGFLGWLYKHYNSETFECGLSKCRKCLYAHQPSGLNYAWLEPYYGKLLKVEYKEPAESGSWRDYTDEIWKIHCDVINHGENLVKSHMKAFVDPKTRFAKLRFTFRKDNRIYNMEPNLHFYELEKAYFEKHGICE